MIRRRPIQIGSFESEELNLTPFLDLMMVLIPFLMLTTSFYSVVVLTAKLPTPVTSSTASIPTFDLLTQVSTDSLRLFVNQKPRLSLALPKDGSLDPAVLEAFHKELVAIKAANPGETRMALDPAPRVTLDRIEQIMDQAVLQVGPDGKKELFPNVALKGVYAP
jgi:biopolymer transport protein ExbD